LQVNASSDKILYGTVVLLLLNSAKPFYSFVIINLTSKDRGVAASNCRLIIQVRENKSGAESTCLTELEKEQIMNM